MLKSSIVGFCVAIIIQTFRKIQHYDKSVRIIEEIKILKFSFTYQLSFLIFIGYHYQTNNDLHNKGYFPLLMMMMMMMIRALSATKLVNQFVIYISLTKVQTQGIY